MNKKIENVLVASHGAAADITHALCLYGNGDMGAGIRRLWGNGICIGVSVAATVLAGYQALCRGASYKRRVRDMAESLGVSDNAGEEVSKQRSERLYAYSAETGTCLNATRMSVL